jgi:DNA-directed RNA polymerase specialized sigma24 family protein
MSDDTVTVADAALEAIRANPTDEDAWTRFYVCFRPQVAAFLYHHGIRAELADVTQDVFFRFIRSSPWRTDWSTLPNRQVVMAYLRKTAQNVVVSRFRDLARRPQEEARDRLDELQGLATTASDVTGLLDRIALELDKFDGDLLRMLMDGSSLDHIASQYQITYGAAGVRVHRLKQKLKLLMGGKGMSR